MKRLLMLFALAGLLVGSGGSVASAAIVDPTPIAVVKSCDDLKSETIVLQKKVVDQVALIAALQAKSDPVATPAELAAATTALEVLKTQLDLANVAQTSGCASTSATPTVTVYPALPDVPVGAIATGGGPE